MIRLLMNCVLFEDVSLRSECEKKLRYYLVYTVCFIVMFLFVFVWYWAYGKTFIWMYDGIEQHYLALVYYGKYLRKIIYSLFVKGLVLPEWDFTLGEGSDILQTLHFYVMGDPLTLLSVAVPSAYTWILFDILIALGMFLAGIAFSLFCFESGKKDYFAVLVGSMVYVFCYWAHYNAARHPNFLNQMIYFPLVLSGVEKIIKDRSPWMFTCAVFLAAINQFYFFYMIVLLTVLYVVVRMVPVLRANHRMALIKLSYISFYALIGALLSAPITLPVMYAFISSSRSGVENPCFILYPLYYYKNLVGNFLSSRDSYWMCMGYSAIVLPTTILLFIKRNKNTFVKVFFLMGLLVMLCPFFGKALNGFSYMSNRWSWAFALVCAYIVTATWQDMFSLSRREILLLSCASAGYLFVCMILPESHGAEAMANICIALLIIIFIILYSTEIIRISTKHAQLLLLFLACASIVSHGYWKHAPSAGNYAAQAVKIKDVAHISNPPETKAVRKAIEKRENKNNERGDFYRCSGEGIKYNDGTYAGFSSTSFHWTISNPYVEEFRLKLGLLSSNVCKHLNYNNITSLNALASVRYYVVPSSHKNVPYGFKYLLTNNKSAVYYNEHALPIAYTYKHSIGLSDWDKMNEIQKQELMLSSVVVADDAADPSVDLQTSLSSASLKYDIACEKGISLENNSFVVTKANASAKLTFEGIPLSENYLVINGLNYDELNYNSKAIIKKKAPVGSVAIKVKASGGNTKTFNYKTPYYSFYSGQKDFAICLDYSKEAINSITITFPKKGVYSIDEMLVVAYPLGGYADKVNALKEDTLKKLVIGTDTVSGNISLDEDKWICFSIPYSKGWKAYVDGKEAELVRANMQYMALKLSAGKHIIKLKYRTPFLRLGAVVSLFGVLTAAVTFIVRKKLRASAA